MWWRKINITWEVLTALSGNTIFFSDVKPCGLVETYRRYRTTGWLHLHVMAVTKLCPKMVSVSSSETSVKNVEYVSHIGMMISNDVRFTREWFICKICAYIYIYIYIYIKILDYIINYKSRNVFQQNVRNKTINVQIYPHDGNEKMLEIEGGSHRSHLWKTYSSRGYGLFLRQTQTTEWVKFELINLYILQHVFLTKIRKENRNQRKLLQSCCNLIISSTKNDHFSSKYNLWLKV